MSERHFDVSQEMLKEIAQTMLELKKMGRSLENAADSLRPLTSNDDIIDKLERISDYGKLSAGVAQNLYLMIAREALTT